MKGSAISDQGQKDSASVSPAEERHGIQRRGLLAKTAAFVAGVVATQAVQPVTANPGDPIYTDRPASGSGTTSLTSSASDFALAVTNTIQSAATFPTAIVGVSRVSNGVGIKGFGVRHGVQGLIEAGNVSAGAIAVQGFCSGFGPDAEGVQGLIVGTGPNFSIQSDNNRAIEGTNYSIGNGLIGVLGTIANTPRTWPPPPPRSAATITRTLQIPSASMVRRSRGTAYRGTPSRGPGASAHPSIATASSASPRRRTAGTPGFSATRIR